MSYTRGARREGSVIAHTRVRLALAGELTDLVHDPVFVESFLDGAAHR